MRAGKLTEEQRQDICKAYREGISSTKLAHQYGLAEPSIIKCLRTRGVVIRPKKQIAKEYESQIAQMYTDGYSATKISDLFDYSASGIRKILRRNDVEIRDECECHRLYPIHVDYLDVIDTEEKAYYLGFFCADGCVINNSLILNIAQFDKDILYKLSKLFYINNPDSFVSMGTRTDRGRYFEDATLSIHSKHMVEKLFEIGIGCRKSLTLKYPILPDDPEIHRWFIRGYYDGDGGGDKKRNCKIIGTQEVISKIKDIVFEQIGILFQMHQHKPEEGKNIYLMVKSGNREKQKFLDWLYRDAKIYLDRKFRQYNEIVASNIEVNRMAMEGHQGFRKQLVDPSLSVRSKFTEEDKELIFKLLEKGCDYSQIQKEYLLCRKAISRLVKSVNAFDIFTTPDYLPGV